MDNLTIFFRWAWKAATEHETFIGLMLLAFVGTMRPRLPGILAQFELLEWIYEWFHDALKVLMSLAGPRRDISPPADPPKPPDPPKPA